MSQSPISGDLLFLDEGVRERMSAQLQLEQAAALIRDAFAVAVAGTLIITALAALLS